MGNPGSTTPLDLYSYVLKILYVGGKESVPLGGKG